MTDLLRYGVIGTGMMGVEHIRDVQALDGAEVVAHLAKVGGHAASPRLTRPSYSEYSRKRSLKFLSTI